MMDFRVLMVSNMFWLSFASFQYTLVVFQSTTSFQACPQAVSGCFWNEAFYALLHPSEQSRLLWKRRPCLVELEQSDWSPRTLAHSNSSSESGSACFLGFPMPAHLSHFISASKVVPSSKGLALVFHSGEGNASHHRQCGRAYRVCTHFHPIWAWTWTSIQCYRTRGDIARMLSGTCSSLVLLLRCLADSVQRKKHHDVSVCVDLETAALCACCTALSDIGAASWGVSAMEEQN